VLRLLEEDVEVYWLEEAFSTGGTAYPAGTFWIPGGGEMRQSLTRAGEALGLTFVEVAESPSGSAKQLSIPRIGLWDRYGGSMPSGWVRFILDEFEFEHRLVFPPELDEGGLIDEFDVLIFPDGAIPGLRGGGGRGGGRYGSADPESVPEEYRGRMGSVTAENTIPRLREFLEAGGTIITLESSTSLGYHLGLPVSDFLVGDDGQPLPGEEFFVPGSLLEVRMEGSSPVTRGMAEEVIVNFARSPVFRIEEEGGNLRALATYDSATPLRSGWAWGQPEWMGLGPGAPGGRHRHGRGQGG
jgi:hypothetical protein